MTGLGLEQVPCPYCASSDSLPWAKERGFVVARCSGCNLIFVNPRISIAAIDLAVRTGEHGADAGALEVTSRRVGAKVGYYRRALASFFPDIWMAGRPISWLDVGAGYGEFLEAVATLAPKGSQLEGLEPMRPKAESARRRGLNITEDYLKSSHVKVQFISFVDVFSHVPDFRAFLREVREVLLPGGELFMETGNLADLQRRDEFPGELGVPDHLVFAGEAHIRGFLGDCGFEVARLERQRTDGFVSFAKSCAKRLLGRPEHLRLPYTSRYRQILVRAKLKG